ncbi:MAG: CHAT domain-containing protein [Oscillatoriales cyanobacterium C42_A2020_001]|nr:CHAT domain-containing protein [Leptolyngbyaceae cyanobacterium C42_A2020_001]
MRLCFQLLSLATTTLLFSHFPAFSPSCFSLSLPATTAQTTHNRKADGDRLFQQGIQQLQNNQNPAAVQSFEQALILYRQIQHQTGVGAALVGLGEANLRLGNSAKALELGQQAIAIAKKLNNPEMEKLARQVLDAAKIADNPRKPEADRLLQQGTQQIQNNQLQVAIQSLDQALTIYRQLRHRPGEGASLIGLGETNLRLGNSAKALELSQQAIAIAKDLNNPEIEKLARQVLDAAQTLANSSTPVSPLKTEADRLLQEGIQQYQTSQFEGALKSWQQALSIYRNIKDRLKEGYILNNLGLAYQDLGNYGKAIEFQGQALAIAQETKDRPSEGRVIGNLGEAYRFLGNYGKAIKYQEQALAIAQEVKNQDGIGNALGNLGNAYFFLGDYGKAILYQELSLAVLREIKDRLREGRILGNLGESYRNLGIYDKAIEYHKQYLSIARSIKDRQGEGISLGGLGVIHEKLGNYSKAIEYQEQRLAITREIKDRSGEGSALGNLGAAYHALGNYAKATEFHQQYLAIAREIKDRQGEGIALNNLGLTLFEADKLAMAETVLLQGIAVWESIRQTGVGNNDANKVSIFEQQARTYRTLQQVLAAQNKINESLEISERGRSRAFVELLTQRIGFPPTLLHGGAVGGGINAVSPPTIQQIQQIAKAQNATLVQYSIIYDDVKTQAGIRAQESTLYVWVIKPSGEIAFRQVPLTQDKSPPQTAQASSAPSNNRGDSPLDALVTQTQIALRGQPAKTATTRSNGSSSLVFSADPASIRRQMRQLHRILIEPIADLLPTNPNDQVIFIPQGSLFFVPFPALRNANGQYLIEQHTIRTAPSIQVLELTRQQRQKLGTQPLIAKGTKALVVGNPTLDLPHAEDEAKTIATLFGTQPVLGAQATKSVIQQKMPEARLIHIAAHGQFNDQQGLGSLLKFAGKDPNTSFLTADEMLNMKLQAELVVLSACQSGLGKLTGDGVIGLSRALISAGTPSVLVSLWNVPDDSTNLLMTAFYQQLQKTPNKAQALRQAMLTMKHQDPIDWAAFTLIGEAE